MKRFFILFVFYTFLLLSCTGQEERIGIELVNKELICKSVSFNSYGNYSKLTFNNDKERIKFTNNVRFRITNATDKKQLFFVKDLRLIDIVSLGITIYDSKGKECNILEPLLEPSFENEEEMKRLGNFYDYFHAKQTEEEQLLKKMNFKSLNPNDYYNQYVIIHPGESFVFTTTLALPFVVEDTIFNLRRPIYSKLDPTKKYEVSLKYGLMEDVDKILPNEILANLKENNVEIFKGTIETQRIPIVFAE